MTIPDPMETLVELTLLCLRVKFTRPPDGLDFYLPDFDLYIECKQFYSERAVRQCKTQQNVLLVQGPKAAAFLATIFAVSSNG